MIYAVLFATALALGTQGTEWCQEVEAPMRSAKAAIAAKKYDEADRILAQLESKHPLCWEVQLGLGRVRYELLSHLKFRTQAPCFDRHSAWLRVESNVPPSPRGRADQSPATSHPLGRTCCSRNVLTCSCWLCIIVTDDTRASHTQAGKAGKATLLSYWGPPRLAAPAHHPSLLGLSECARGEGHPLWVLTVGYPGGITRQVSLRPEQVPQVRRALRHYHDFKTTLEAISELNQFLLRLDREESKSQER